MGAALPPAQLDETLEDLAFFLDEFGSTRAARMKLQEQESDIKRFQDQVQRLVNIRSGGALTEETEKQTNCEENTTIGTENATEAADETRTELDFLRPYGSMRAVRKTLERQTREIAGLQRTIEWLRERRSRARLRQDASDAGVDNVNGCPAPALTLETRDDRQDEDFSSMGESDRVDGVDGNEESGIFDVATVGEAGDDVEMASPEEERPRGGSESVKKVTTESKEASVVVTALPNLEMARHADEAAEDRRLEPEVVADDRQDGDTSSMDGVDGNAGITSPGASTLPSPATTRRTSFYYCSFPGCEKRAKVHGLCVPHGGYRTCTIDGCNRKAVVRRMCRQHGGRRCGTSGCEKAVTPLGHGHCLQHARENGFKMKATCNSVNCEVMPVSGGHGHCFKHAIAQGFEVKYQCRTAGCKLKRVSRGQGHCFKHAVAQGFELTKRKAKCKADGCFEYRVGEHYCETHSGLEPPSLHAQSSTQVDTLGDFYDTCKARGCLEWVKQNDTSEYCSSYQAVCTLGEENSSATANQVDARRHGGGYRCKAEGCTKARKIDGLCASHGGKSECEGDGCSKVVVANGCCTRHRRQRVALEVAMSML